MSVIAPSTSSVIPTIDRTTSGVIREANEFDERRRVRRVVVDDERLVEARRRVAIG
jgi:hypothetical protein